MDKVLRVNLIMELPSGFQGSLEDALRLFLDLRDAETIRLNPRDVSARVAWEAFAVNRRHGARAVCEDGIFSLRSGSWRRVDKPPEGAVITKDTWVK